MGRERERNLKDDLEREREEIRMRERQERDRLREREMEMQNRASGSKSLIDGSAGQNNSSSSVSMSAGAGGENEWHRREREREMDMATRIQLSPRDGRERDREREREHDFRERESDRDAQQQLYHQHSHSLSHTHSQSSQLLQASELSVPYNSQSLSSSMSQDQKQKSHSTATHTMTGKPRVSRSGVLKLAPPGVAVHNYPPPSSSDLSLVNSLQSGLILRADPMRVQQQHNHNHNQGSKAPKPDPHSGPNPKNNPRQHHQSLPSLAEMQLPSPPPQSARSQHEQPPTHQRQHSRSSGPHSSYTSGPIGPGVPPPPNASISMREMSMIPQHPKHSQHAHQYGAPASLPQQQTMHPHTHSLPTPPSSTSGPGMPQHSPHHPPFRQIPPPLMAPQHQSYMPHSVHSYNEAPPAPVPMALQPMVRSPPPPEQMVSESPVNLGTFVFPRTPFPYFFPSRRESESRRTTIENEPIITSPSSLKRRREPELPELRDRPTHVTILIPFAHLPSALPSPSKPRVWGGALITVNDPYFAGTPFGMYVPRAPHSRRVYTDDSDIALVALHTGRVSWSGMKRARAAKLDLKVTLSLCRDVGRYVGSRGAVAEGTLMDNLSVDRGLKSLLKGKGEEIKDDDENVKGWSMLTGTWDSGHDGSGIEVLNAEWIPVRVLYSYSL